MQDILLRANPNAVRLEIGCEFCGAYLYAEEFAKQYSVFCGLLRRRFIIGCDESPMGWGKTIEDAIKDRDKRLLVKETRRIAP